MTDLHSALAICTPELILALGAMFLLVFGAFRGPKAGASFSALAGLVLIAAAFAAGLGALGTTFGGSFVMDRTAAYAKVAMYIASAVCVVLGDGWMERFSTRKFEYPVLILLANIGMSMMVSS